MGGKSTPKAPDYRALAEEQAKSSREVTEQQTWANRPTQNTPWGQVDWQNTPTWDPSTGQWLNRWEQNMTLTPEEQASLSAQQRITQGRSGLAESMLGRAEGEFSDPMDWEQFGDYADLGDYGGARDRAEEALYGRATSRLDRRMQEGREAKELSLLNQGLRPGDQAYDRAMQDFTEGETDAYNQAMYSSIIGGGKEATSEQNRLLQGAEYENTVRQSQIAEDMQRRGFSLNEINAILHGQQIGMPGMPEFNKAQRSQATQYSQAGRDQYGAELDAFNAEQAALQGLMSGASGFVNPFSFGGK